LNVPTASATNRGALSAADWTTFNNKQNALTNPVTGTGTSGTIPVFTGSTTLGNSIIQSNSTEVNIVGNGSRLLFDSLGSTNDGGIGYTNSFDLLINNSRGSGSAIFLGNINMDFHTNVSGNPRLRITADGNILIGTTTDAGFKLDVNGTGRFSGNVAVSASSVTLSYGTGIQIGNGTTDNGIRFNVGSGGWGFTEFFQGSTAKFISGYRDANNTYNIKSGNDLGGSNGITITSGGNVLIGTTTNDGAKLRVEGGEVRVTTSNSGVALYQSLGNGEIAAYNWGGGAYIPLVHVGSEHRFNTSTTERMRITSGGSVGINNTSPMNSAWGTDATTKQLSIDASSYAVINLQGSTSRKYSMGVGDGNFFMCYDNTAARHNITVTSAGNVLIGTTSDAGSRLRVAGNLLINGFQRMFTYVIVVDPSSTGTVTISSPTGTNMQGSMQVMAGGYGNGLTGNITGLWIASGLLFFDNASTSTITQIVNSVTNFGSMSFQRSGDQYTVTLTNTASSGGSTKSLYVSVIINGD
jgi:hypothetical protein